jgi:hypothetical protein
MKARYIIILLTLHVSYSFGQSMTVKGGIDTTRNVKWKEMPYSPHMLLKTEIEIDQSDLLLVLYCDTSIFAIVKPDTLLLQHCIDELRLNLINNAASSGTLYNNCVIDYFIENKEKYKIDTVWIDNGFVIHPINIFAHSKNETTYFISQMETYDTDTNYYTKTEFYTIEELKDVCISENFRYKSVEVWVKGEKHGKWKYWNLNGILTKEIQYEHGNIIKETTY